MEREFFFKGIKGRGGQREGIKVCIVAIVSLIR